MRAFLYIDDGSFSVDVETERLDEMVAAIRVSLLTAYALYGLALSILKTIISLVYMQFLNEIYLHGVHIAYGFRALCHTGAQTFPEASTVAEELAVIYGGIRGAADAGGHPLRLMAGYHFILYLYMQGVVGGKGTSIRLPTGFAQATHLMLPTIAGGYGLPSWTRMFSNLSGDRDVEKLAAVRMIGTLLRKYAPDRWSNVREYMKAKMGATTTIKSETVPDRITMAHPGSAAIGSGDRSLVIAKGAHDMATNRVAQQLLQAYIISGAKPSVTSFARAFTLAAEDMPVALPTVVWNKALATDPNAAVITLVNKIASSGMVSDVVSKKVVNDMNRTYYRRARFLARAFDRSVSLSMA
jgi:hypothetical protein